MVGQKCYVRGCGNESKFCLQEISFHSFPSDEKLKRRWISFCNQPSEWSPKKGATICSKHFEKNDYNPLFGPSLRRRLKRTALPSVKFNCAYSDSEPEELDFPEYTSIQEIHEFENLPPETTESIELVKNECTHCIFLKSKINDMQNQISQLKKLNTTLSLKLSVERKDIKKLENSMATLKDISSKQLENFSTMELSSRIKEILAGTLSSVQLDKILNIKKKVKWPKDDIAKAFTLRYFSKRAYIYMQEQNYPLPNLRTLQRYAQSINLSEGILFDILQFMQISAQKMTFKEKATVLLYDEMKVRSLFEYNKKGDEVIGPHSYVQVVIARSLFGTWKQPVYIGFDNNMNINILLEIIIALHKVSFDVVAIVGDLGSSNQGTLSKLGVTVEKEYFQHPCSEGNIYCFPDAPHLLKLIRNWLLRTGFVFPSGHCLTKKPLEDILYKSNQLELSSLHKLTERHLLVLNSYSDKQNVSLAAHLLSHTTATALRRYSKDVEYKNLSTFIDLINDWFDIMNSRHIKESVYFKKPFEGTEGQQNRLNEMFNTMTNLRCIGKDNLQVFQKAILISIKSLLGLFEYNKDKYDITYLITSKLNQDSLESLFGQLRTRGGLDDHPTPLNILHRLRMLILGKSPGVVQHRTNIHNFQENEEFLMSTFLKEVEITPLLTDEVNQTLDDLENSSASSSSSKASSTTKQVEEDGLTYLSGWLARKFSKQYPDLGTYTYMLKHEEHNYCKPSWVQHLSHGGLTEPSNKLKKNILILEKEFKNINKNKFKIKKNIVTKLYLRLKDKVSLPEEVSKAFLKQRVFIRMKKLNSKILFQNKNKGKNKKIQKLKKITQ